MRRFAAEHDLDLDASWAYSDSVSDLPMLELVGNPVAVNPDAELARDRPRARLADDAASRSSASGSRSPARSRWPR